MPDSGISSEVVGTDTPDSGVSSEVDGMADNSLAFAVSGEFILLWADNLVADGELLGLNDSFLHLLAGVESSS